MSAPDNTQFQANFKTSSGALLNIYASDAGEFQARLIEFSELIPHIVSTESALLAGGTVAAHIPLAPASQQPAPSFQAQQPAYAAAPVQAAPATNGAPTCRHGAMVWVEPANKPWKGWFCPQPKEATDKCTPQFVKG